MVSLQFLPLKKQPRGSLKDTDPYMTCRGDQTRLLSMDGHGPFSRESRQPLRGVLAMASKTIKVHGWNLGTESACK